MRQTGEKNLIAGFLGVEVVVIDNWAMALLSEPERGDRWEICEDRYHVSGCRIT